MQNRPEISPKNGLTQTKKEREQNPFKRFFKNPTRNRAIAAFCCECVGGTKDKLPDPGWKNLIRFCTANGKDGHECPLYRYRPYK